MHAGRGWEGPGLDGACREPTGGPAGDAPAYFFGSMKRPRAFTIARLSSRESILPLAR